MDKKDSNIYVAELLQQLEELKRRKERRMQKLQRLGKHTKKQTGASKGQPQSNTEILISDVQNTSLGMHLQENKTNAHLMKCLQCSSVLNASDKCCVLCKTSDENRRSSDSKYTFPLRPSNLENAPMSQQISFCKQSDSKSSIKCTEKNEVGLDSNVKIHVNANWNERMSSIQRVLSDSNSPKSYSIMTSERQKQSISVSEEEIENEPDLDSEAKVHMYANCDEKILSPIQKVLIISNSTTNLPKSFSTVTSEKQKQSISVFEKVVEKELGLNSEAKIRSFANCDAKILSVPEVHVDSNSISLPKSYCIEAPKKQRKRSTSMCEEFAENCKYEAKKIRVSEEFDTIPEQVLCNNNGSEGDVLVVNITEHLFKEGDKNISVEIAKDSSPESILTKEENEVIDEMPENGMDDSLSSMACFLSGSFAIEGEDDENPRSEDSTNAVITTKDEKSGINVESLPNVLKKDDSGSSEKVPSINSISFSSAKFSSPFSDELTFPATIIENLSSEHMTSKVIDAKPCSISKSVINVDHVPSSSEKFNLESINVHESNIYEEHSGVYDFKSGINQDNSPNYQMLDKGLERTASSTSESSFQRLTDNKEIQPPALIVETSLDDASSKKILTLPSVSKFSDFSSRTFDKPTADSTFINKEVQVIHVDDQDEMDDNLTPSLLDSTSHLQFECAEESKDDLKPSAFKQETVDITNDECGNALDSNAVIVDLGFDSLSLVAVDTVEDSLRDSTTQRAASKQTDDYVFKVPQIPEVHCIEISDTELCAPDSELFTIPETEMLEPSCFHKEGTLFPNPNIDKSNFNSAKNNLGDERTCGVLESKCNLALTSFSHFKPCKPSHEMNFGGSKILDSCSSFRPKTSIPLENHDVCAILDDSFSESLTNHLEQYDVLQDTLMVEDTLELGIYKNIPFLMNENIKDNTPHTHTVLKESSDDPLSNIQFTYCMHSEVHEPVSDVKITFFNRSYYAFIQYTTWIQVWRQEERDWNKIFSHEIEDIFQLKEICFSQNDAYLVLVMLLCSGQGHCLQFVLFEKEVRIIKLMEQAHWLQNSCPEESVLLCGLESLRFATAQGKENFEVFVHAFSCLKENPRLLMASLGPTVGGLHSLCKIEKLPNALLGTSDSMLYVWHLLETRLVTSVCLQPLDILPIERCIWAIIENGLVFFLTVCGNSDSPHLGQLYAANLATGFCQLATPYTMIPATESTHFGKKNLKAVYSEPFLVASCSDGGFLWSVTDEYCCAALGGETNITAITIVRQSDEVFTIAIGNSEGCVNCYNLKYT